MLRRDSPATSGQAAESVCLVVARRAEAPAPGMPRPLLQETRAMMGLAALGFKLECTAFERRARIADVHAFISDDRRYVLVRATLEDEATLSVEFHHSKPVEDF